MSIIVTAKTIEKAIDNLLVAVEKGTNIDLTSLGSPKHYYTKPVQRSIYQCFPCQF